MGPRRRMWESVVAVGLGAVALILGSLVGASGCALCNCPPLPHLQLGAYEIIDSARPELIGGMVEIAEDLVEVSFTDAEGNDWVINYAVESN